MTVLEMLRSLRKGRGLLAHDLDRRFRPEFRALFAATSDTDTTLRDKLVKYLEELLPGLPEVLERAARIALNMPPDDKPEILRQRMARLAAELYVDDRTVRRHIDAAFKRMAATAATGGGLAPGLGFGGGGWYVDTLEAVLLLDLPSPEAIERHTIVATAQTLDRITISIDIPHHPEHRDGDPRLLREVMFGGLVAGDRRESSTNFSTVVALSRTLRKGDRHTYGLISRIPQGQPMAPRYVYIPYRRCRYFSLLVRFHPDRLPGEVWRHDGVPHSVVTDGIPSEDRLTLNRANEVTVSFGDLIGGCAYGVQWR
jgi:AcrR family transcriptional regulator